MISLKTLAKLKHFFEFANKMKEKLQKEQKKEREQRFSPFVLCQIGH